MTIDDDAGAADWRARDQIGHRLVVGEELLVHRVGKGGADRRAIGIRLDETVVARTRAHVIAPDASQPYEAVRFPDRHLGEQEAVDGAEDGRVRANPERERQNDDRRPPLGMQQHADSVAQILQHRSSRSPCGPTCQVRGWSMP
jgi:hypothetical protein